MKSILTAIVLFAAQLSFGQSMTSNAIQSTPPVLEGCEHISESELQVCFNRKVMQHIMDELQWPEGLEKDGKVIVEVVFDETGSISKVSSLRGFDPLADQEAVRVIQGLPAAVKPATKDGAPTSISFKIPVQFIGKQK